MGRWANGGPATKKAIVDCIALIHKLHFKVVVLAGSDDTWDINPLDVTRALIMNLLEEANVLLYDMMPLSPTFLKNICEDGNEDFDFSDGFYFHMAQIAKVTSRWEIL